MKKTTSAFILSALATASVTAALATGAIPVHTADALTDALVTVLIPATVSLVPMDSRDKAGAPIPGTTRPLLTFVVRKLLRIKG